MTEQSRDLVRLVLVFIVLSLVTTGCGETYSYTPAPQEQCHVTSIAAGARITCPDGSGAIVANGAVGGVGPAGPSGPQGPVGTVIVPVQLCPNVAPIYASIFPEYALCIDGALYGTYNQNTSYQYLAELPDGTYSSNGQGAACSLTITGCVVTY